MAKPHARGYLEHARAGGRLDSVPAEPEYLRGAPKECGVPYGVGRREQQQSLRWLGQRGYTPTVVVLDPARNIRCVGKGEAAREPPGIQAAWELQQSQWIAARLSYDPVPYALVETTLDGGLEHGARICVCESFQPHLG